ncbi:O-antigen ligase [Sinorhizobium fredii]|uniref:Putative transmembrane protein n=1 Tax=Sinorhizobium fredii (strain USDA 257) TaxID=1185652 RepID=I3X7H3_SINF2|nr:O-antigen ligase family protein [Sinorhizobium fredii]AFL51829.1 putative transmembrane protein [Sinorhizobium fredii USDA 257]
MISANASQAAIFRPQLAAVSIIGSGLVTIGVFLSGFVIAEPAPYEVFMAGLIGLWFLFGLKISRAIAPLLALLILFMIGGMLSLTVMDELATGPLYMAVSGFLALTAVFFAAIVEDRHQRLRLIFNAWVSAAVITALLGILGYFGAIPGAAHFTLYDRAKGAFQDPNVFGPFLAAPVLYLVHGLLTQPIRRAPSKIAGLVALTLGVFLSFSRAAWALNLFCVAALIFVMLLKERSGLFRLRILVLTLCGALFVMAALAAALQSEQVAALFSSRSQLVQDYDGGHLGRFDRHRIGFLMSMERPLGMGPLMFGMMFLEDEHNVWLKSLTSYGWLGFVAYVTLIAWTLALGFRLLLLDRPWQPHLMIAWVTLVGHVGIGNVIDTDHWRHFYMLLGIVWGCAALEYRNRRQVHAERHALP